MLNLTEGYGLLQGEWNSVAALRLGSQFFEDAVSRIAKGEPVAGPEPTLSPIALLKVSSCLGHHQASLLLATVHLAGFGVPVDLQQVHSQKELWPFSLQVTASASVPVSVRLQLVPVFRYLSGCS